MDTSVDVEPPGRRAHRRHSAEFKAQVIRACRQPGVSVAAVALTNGLNANMLRRWVLDAERAGAMAVSGQGAQGVSAMVATSSRPGFVAVQMAPSPESSPEPDIHIEFKRGTTTIVVRWPAGLAGACATWLREMLR
jgi:transposase